MFFSKKDKENNEDYYSKSRNIKESLGAKLKSLLTGRSIDESALEEMEEILLKADIGPIITGDLINLLRKKTPKDADESLDILKDELKDYLIRKEISIDKTRLNVFMILGVNGVGKTTSIAKMAHLYGRKGYKVMLAAGDTFRAAAVEQLTGWAEKLDIPIIRKKDNSDPSGVAFDAVDSAKAKGIDLLLIDTAGRLHTKANLMEELKKIERVIEKKEDIIKQNILVIDATTGQNAYTQSESFNNAIGVDGILLAKYDSQAKGGIVFNIQKNLKLPFYFIGSGEKITDIEEFKNEEFIKNIFS